MNTSIKLDVLGMSYVTLNNEIRFLAEDILEKLIAPGTLNADGVQAKSDLERIIDLSSVK